MPKHRHRIAEGIFRVGTSLTAKVQVGSGDCALSEEKAFPRGTSLKEINEWRDEKRVELRKQVPTVGRGTIAAEMPRYLERCRKTPASLASKTSEMKAWVAEIGHLRRHLVKPEHIDSTIIYWLEHDVSKKTILNRCRTLHHFYVTMANDKRARTPLDHVKVPKPDKRRPQAVAAALIIRTEKRLRAAVAAARARLAREQRRPLKDRKPKQFALEMLNAAHAHARFMVQAADGIRPSQLKRVAPAGVDLKGRLVEIPPGKGGLPITIAMNEESHAAWSAFVAAAAFGSYDDSKYRRRLRAAGWPADLRPYETKHTVGIALAEAGADHEDIKDRFGHTDTKTVKIYTGTPIKRLRRVAAMIDHRFGWAHPSPADVPRKTGGRRRQVADSGGNSARKESA